MAIGDRLLVRRRLAGLPICYRHHGIDVGDGTVTKRVGRPLAAAVATVVRRQVG